jgi:ATP-dependent helicase HrpA
VDTLVPGLFEEKIAALIKALPKKFRVKLVPVSDKARIIAQEIPRQDKPLFTLLSAFIQKKFNLAVPPTLWSDKALPDHLKMRISIRDEQGREIKAIRDKRVLNEFPATRVPPTMDGFALAREKHEVLDILEWNFNDLEPCIIVSREKEFTQKAYPGLRIEPSPKSPKSDTILSLRLFTSDAAARESHCQGVRQLFLKSFPDQFKALKKDIKAAAGIRQMAPFFNGQSKFQAAVFDLITTTLFARDIRTKKGFDDLAHKELPRLFTSGQDFIGTLVELGTAYQSSFELIQKLSFQHQTRKKTFEILTLLFQDLKNLVPPHFATLYTYGRIKNLERYVTCIGIRAQKAVDNPLKEETKAKEVTGYTRHLNRLLSGLSENSSSEKSRKVEEFFWLLEEYKISVFAQEIKTRLKISKKKLDHFLAAVSSMI